LYPSEAEFNTSSHHQNDLPLISESDWCFRYQGIRVLVGKKVVDAL
jgi:hypothetical protein